MQQSDLHMVKALTAALIRQLGGVQAAAVHAGSSPAMISHYANPNRPHTVSAHALVMLTRASGNTALMDHIRTLALEDRAGADVSMDTGPSALLRAVRDVQREGAEAVTMGLDVLADVDVLTGLTIRFGDRARLMKELTDAETAIQAALRLLSSWGGETDANQNPEAPS